MRERVLRFTVAAVLALSAGTAVRAADAEVDYLKEIKPLLHERCYACHGGLKQEGGLRLDTAALAIRGGESGPAIAPGDAAASLLLQRVSAQEESERMPPEGEPLTAAQIAKLRSWIESRASAPQDEQPEADPRAHWAFRAPVRPSVPEVASPEWQRNPIDAFLAKTHADHGLTPQRRADKRLWLRRVSLDLVGLPPTQAELDAFAADESSDAYDRVVNRLLESPQYGERWGRHWMDVWRYSDWWGLGAEVRNSQKHIWHWRDWIVESLNADKGYDQMLREMLAADELYPDDLARLRAGGFLARQYFKFNRTTWLDGVVEHTSKAMLGLTANCAKCHDHKYDPISHVEYYQLRAIFEPYQLRTDAVAGELDHEKDGIPRPFDCNLDAETFLHIRGDDRNPDKSIRIEPTVPAVVRTDAMRVARVTLSPVGTRPGLREFVVAAHRERAEQKVTAAKATLAAARTKLETAEKAAGAAEDAKGDSTAPKPAPPPITDNFSAERPDLWKVRSGQWTYRDGKLIQSAAGGSRAAIRATVEVPANFEAKLRYTPTGGDQWRSVGIAFDLNESGNEVLAYLSSHEGGPKAQITYLVNGNHAYPGEGARPRPVALNQPHELTLRVRDRLVNMIVDGEPAVAYRLPIERQQGSLELITFDATAEFQSFELRELSPSVVLNEPAAGSSKTEPPAGPGAVEQARLEVAIAEKGIVTAEADLKSVAARAAADRARFLESLPPETLKERVQQAVTAERTAAVARADEEIARAELAVKRASKDKLAEAEKRLQASRETRMKAQEGLAAPGESYTSLPGAYKTLESNVEDEASRAKPFPETSTGRRSAFARWLTDRNNPLAARVAVNHIWARHFGRPLVPTVFDFGRKGTPPTHPELLDWLAVELMEQGWSMKHIHRLIVTSEAYRLSSSAAGADARTLAADPENRWYWRMNPSRMEAQVVRDSLLHLAGELDLKMGGPSIPVDREQSRRRSLYFVHSHNDHQPFLSMFDDASVLDCYRRAESIVPQQALALENSSLAIEMADRIARRLNADAANDEQFVRRAFLTVLASEATAEEQRLIAETLPRMVEIARREKRPDPELHARIRLVQVLLNHNDFVTIR